MNIFRIILCIFIVLTLIFFNWNDISNEHNIYSLLLCSLAIIITEFTCINSIRNWNETRPKLVSVVEGCSLALFGILMALASWNIYSTKGDIAMSLFGASLSLGSIVFSLSSFFNWKKDRPKLYTISSIAVRVLFLISFLALFIYGIMSM